MNQKPVKAVPAGAPPRTQYQLFPPLTADKYESHSNRFVENVLPASIEREQKAFSQWLQKGGRLGTDAQTTEGREAWCRLHELYEFCKWAKDHDAVIKETMPSGLVAADGPDERRWEPEHGVSIGEWPYLKECCGPKADEDFIQISRNEIAEATLWNELMNRGHSLAISRVAVNELIRECDATGCESFWMVMEEPADEVMIALNDCAKEIAEKLRNARQEWIEAVPHPDGPQKRETTEKPLRMLWYRGEPYLLTETEFDLVSLLWAASDRSLPFWEVAQKVWDVRPAAVDESDCHTVRAFVSKMGNTSLMGSGITIAVRKDPLGHLRVWLELP